MMDGIYQSWQNGVMWACLGMLGVMAVGIILYGFGQAWGKVREWWSLPLIERVLAGVFVVGFAYYGSTKHGAPSVRWDDGLRDNGTLITNDTVAVRWTYSGIPGASSVFIDYREAGTTNDWLNLAETLASAQEWTGTLANATNYDYWVYSTYVPPVPVHTNGVWVGQAYETKAKVGAAAFLILNGKVVADGRTIAPPKWAEPSVPYDAEVEYLESTGTQYIDTGVTADWSGLCVELDMMLFAHSDNEADYFGATNPQTGFNYAGGFNSLGTFVLQIGTGWVNYGSQDDKRHLHIYDSPNNRAGIDGNYKSWNTWLTSSGNFYILQRLVGGIISHPSHNRHYRAKFIRNGSSIRDFIPVRKGNVGYMYDRVSGQLFGNAGTGVFTVGPDK